VELVVVLEGADAEKFLADLEKPISKTNRELIESAKKFKFEIR